MKTLRILKWVLLTLGFICAIVVAAPCILIACWCGANIEKLATDVELGFIARMINDLDDAEH